MTTLTRRSFFGALLVIMIVMCALVFITYRKGYDDGQLNTILRATPDIEVFPTPEGGWIAVGEHALYIGFYDHAGQLQDCKFLRGAGSTIPRDCGLSELRFAIKDGSVTSHTFRY